MEVGDLVRFKHRGQNPPIGIVLGIIRHPMNLSNDWYYLVKWSNESINIYCHGSVIEKHNTGGNK
tara:strand:- start:30 stop:224 length:195 start_codon:yes stop_codon:yes gene_type:complete